MKNSIFSIVCLCLCLLFTTSAIAKNRYGVILDTCQFDFDAENFCSDKNIKKFAHILETRKANFVHNKILYIYKSSTSVMSDNNSSYRMVVIDKTTRKVQPFYWAFNPAKHPVNTKGDFLEFQFNKSMPMFCVKGNIEAYRNAYNLEKEDDHGFCFPYVGNNDEDEFSAGFAGFI